MADVLRNCTNCGNAQSTGAFCEKCGARLPEPGAVPAGAAPQPGQPGTYPQTPGTPYQYGPPQQPGPFSKLFDLSFQGFVTRGSLRTLYITTLALIGVYWVFTFIFSIVQAAKGAGWWALGIFSSLALVAVIVVWTRIMMELTMTVSKLSESAERTAQTQAAVAKPAASKPASTAATAKKTTGTKTTGPKTTGSK